jgi:adenylate kinase family enzyme
MGNYDLSALDDKEFETLVCRLLSIELKYQIERFKPGRDGGADGRFFSEGGGETIVQCKHWARTPVSSLLRSLETTEAPKVAALGPSRYLLVTSIELSRRDKARIKSIFEPFIKTESDVMGHEDLQDLLSRNSDVVKNHPALWLASADVIGMIQNAAILGRSDFSLDEIRQRASRYVPTKSHSAAKARLEKMGAVLITGSPGIGKTTLAEQLCLEYVLGGYQLCALGESIEEAESIYKSDKNQIFYFDDFLGRNYLEALGRHEDSRIVGFIKRVQKDANKRFVLTSRTTVLNQAKVLSDQFGIGKVDRTELEIRVEALDRMDRARILHKHLWYSELRSDVLQEILLSRRYVDIVEHKNFNPRLIQFITDAQRFDDDDPSKYWSYVEDTLTNPSGVWQHVLDSQLDDFSRALLLLCCFNGGGGISEVDLRSAFSRLKAQAVSRTFRGNGEFTRNSRLVTGSVLTRAIVGQYVHYSLFNPSIADYVFPRYSADVELLTAIFSSLLSATSLRTLENLKDHGFVPTAVQEAIIEALLLQHLPESSLDIEYRWLLAGESVALAATRPNVKQCLVDCLPALLDVTDDTIRNWESIAVALGACLQAGFISSANVATVFRVLGEADVNSDETLSLTELYLQLGPEQQDEVLPTLKDRVIDVWQNAIGEELVDSGNADEYLSEDDWFYVMQTARAFIEERLDAYPFTFTSSEIESILEYVDSGEIIHKNQRRESREHDVHDIYPTRHMSPAADAIDELFNMDLPRS